MFNILVNVFKSTLSFVLLIVVHFIWLVKGYARYLLQCIDNIFIVIQTELQIMLQTSKVHDIFTNLRHITTRITSSIKVTPEPAPIAIYVVCSSPVRIINYKNLDI